MSRIVPSQVVAFINDAVPDTMWSGLGPGNVGELAGLLTLIDKIPDELLAMESETYSKFVLAVSTIKEQITIWRYGGPRIAPDLFGPQRARHMIVLREALLKCPDEVPAPATSSLMFIQDNDLRQSLRNDISTVYRALADGEWKAATVLAGSVIEALLLWGVEEKRTPAEINAAVAALTVRGGPLTHRPDSSLERWVLHEFIEVAFTLGIIEDETAIQARLSRHFRNLIHPGMAQRLQQKCNRATTYSAVAAMEHVINDLQ